MRVASLVLILMLPLFMACKVLPAADVVPRTLPSGPSPSDAVALADGSNQGPDTEVRPRPRPESTVEAAGDIDPGTPGQPAPVAQKSPEQIKCEKQNGRWGGVGRSSAKACIKQTRDAGKQCRKQSDCDSVCLARSGTCAPVKPLFGCNEILQNDGRRVTLCVD